MLRRVVYTLVGSLIAMLTTAYNPRGIEPLTTAIRKLDQDPVMDAASWGVCVIDTRSGETLASHNANKALTPASTLKTITTATALGVLGADFRFQTYVEYDGDVQGGVLLGNLYLRGTGDPTLGTKRFNGAYSLEKLLAAAVQMLRQAGIQSVEGNIIGDGTAFSAHATPAKWTWEDMGNYYGAAAQGLNICENSYELFLRSGTAGSRAEVVGCEPAMPDVQFISEVIARGSKDEAYIFGAPYTDLRYVHGTIPAGHARFAIKGSMPEPAKQAAAFLLQAFRKAGIAVSGNAHSLRQLRLTSSKMGIAQRKPLGVFQSPSLAEIVEQTNYHSINLYAEALLKAAAQHADIDTEAAVAALKTYWQQHGVSTEGVFMHDGSGLSPSNAVRPTFMAEVLCEARRSSFSESFFASLPVAAQSGTVASLGKGTALAGKVRVKSGFITGTRAYTGYLTTKSGREVAFAIMANNFACTPNQMRDRLEDLLLAMMEL